MSRKLYFIKQLNKLAFMPMDISGLAIVRMLYGLLIIYESWRYSDLRIINYQFTGQILYFKFRFFEWVEPLSPAGIQIIFIAYGVAGMAIFLGIFYRVATLTAAFCISYIFLLDATNYLNHFYLIIIFAFLMFFIPAHRGWSLYALLHPHKALQSVPGWSIWALRAQLIIVYSYAALAKMNVDWMNGMPLYDWIGYQATDTGIESLLDSIPVIYLFTYGGLLYDLLVIPGLLIKRTRALAYCCSIGFHLMNYYLFNIGIFPWFMLATTTIFFESSWPREFLNFFFPNRFLAINLRAPLPHKINFWSRVGFSALCIHLAFQALFPLRHFLYPSYVGWSEEGHNFSWHMKLRDKNGKAVFRLRDPDTGKTVQINSERYLTQRQIDKIANRPYLMLQFAHFLRDRYTRAHERPAEIYVDSWVSINGREAQRLIDPRVNLASVSMKEFGNTWILPLRQPVWNAENKKNRFGPAFKYDETARQAGILSRNN
jgi:hypothetical protein